MANKQLIIPGNRAFNSNGLPIAGAQLKLFTTSTTTPANFYSYSGIIPSLGTTHTPTGAGRYPAAYQNEATAFRLQILDLAGTVLDDIDPFYFGASTDAAVAAAATATSVAAAAASATSASGSATAASGSATAAAASATTASTQATNAASSATTATTQAGLATTNGAAQVTLATTQATNAAASATAASTSATNAATSETNAATSAAAAAAATVTTPQSLDIGYRIPNMQLYWPERATASFLVKATDGTLVANSSWTTSDYMPVEAGGSFTISAALTMSTPNGLAYYKADKTYLSGVVGPFTAGQSFTPPANAAFVRIGVLKTVSLGFVVIRGSTAPTVVADHTYSSRTLPQSLDNAYRSTDINLIIDAKATASFLINSTTGATSANSSWKASDYFPVDANGSITIGAAIGGSSPFGLAFYDQTKTYVSGVAAPFTAAQVVSVPDGVFYARIGYTKVQASALVIVAGSTAPGLPEAHTTARRKDYRLRDLGYRPADLTLLDIASVTRNVNIRSATGVVDNPYANVTTTGYIPVTPGGSVTVGSAMVVGSPYGCAFFDINQVYISGVDGPFTAGQVLTVPNGGHYFRISYPTGIESTVFFLEGSQTPGTNQDLYRLPRVSDVRPWSGKNIAGLGDSIMANHAYMAKVATSIHATLSLNASVVGRKMQDALKDSSGVALSSGNFTTVAAALLALGTNDYGNSTVFGTISDSTATASFFGYTKLAVETIIGWKPDIVMILATPMWRSDTAANSVGKVLADYAQAIRDVAALYSLPVLDNFKYSRFNSLTSITYFDGLHPTTAGDDAFMVPNTVGFFETLRPAG